MSKKLIIVGGGGHARVLIDLISEFKGYSILGIVDENLEIGSEVLGVPVIARDQDLERIFAEIGCAAVVGVGSVKDNTLRKRIFEKLKFVGFDIPSLVHPAAIIAGNVQLQEGVHVMAGAIVQVDVQVGENTIINTGAQLDHGCQVGSHVHIAPGAVFSGDCKVEDEAFVGVGATVIHGRVLGKGCVVGAGSVVVKDVEEGQLVKGVPAV